MALLVKLLRAVVRNDAMRDDPDAVYGWRVFALAIAACFGGMLFGWETGAIGGILAMAPTQDRFGTLHRSKAERANLDQNIVSTLQAGSFVACLVTSWLADRCGGGRCLVATGGLAMVGVAMQAASAARGSLALMYAGRFFTSLGVGAASSLTPLYVSECAPRAIRGGLTSFYQLFIVMGIMIAFWCVVAPAHPLLADAARVNYGCALHVPAPAVYILPLAFQTLPALLLIGGMFLSPESPRWCAQQDDWERATEILVDLRRLPADSGYVARELREMADQLEAERRLTGAATTMTLLKEVALVPGNRYRAIISVVLVICQQMTGVNAINYYAPQILENLGMDDTRTLLFATGVYGVAKTVACFVFLVFVADSLGRRLSLLWTSAVQAVLLFVIGIYGRVQPPVPGRPVSAFGYVAITCIYLWAAAFQFGWGPVCWIVVSEIPTARLRAVNVAMSAAVQWLFNFVVARTVLAMQNTMGRAGYGMFFLFGSFDVLMGVFVWFCLPETKGLSLEEMDELFGVTETASKPSGDEPEQQGGVTRVQEVGGVRKR